MTVKRGLKLFIVKWRYFWTTPFNWKMKKDKMALSQWKGHPIKFTFCKMSKKRVEKMQIKFLMVEKSWRKWKLFFREKNPSQTPDCQWTVLSKKRKGKICKAKMLWSENCIDLVKFIQDFDFCNILYFIMLFTLNDYLLPLNRPQPRITIEN